MVYLILIYLIWYVKAPWWLYIFAVTGLVDKTINFLMGIYDAGRESKNGRDQERL